MQASGESLASKPFRGPPSCGQSFSPTVVLPIQQGLRSPLVFSSSVEEHPRIDHYIEKYTDPRWKAWLEGVLERAFIYRDHIVKSCDSIGVPREFQFLPLVESAYNIQAVSKSGAVGLWQFMLNSIGPYDLQVNDWVDDRRDFWKSTEAALKKIKYNYSVLNDWLLALAAYNCGLGRMTRIIQSTELHDFWDLADGGHLPYETAEYIPKFLALAKICSYPGRYGLSSSWEPPVIWERISLSQAVDITILGEKAGVPPALLKKGNAELKYSVTPPGNTNYFLKVPAEYSDAVKETLENSELKLMEFYIYSIQSGDTLYDLSNHYGVSVSMIRNYNPRIQPRSLRIGQRIIIPCIRKVPPYSGRDRIKPELPGTYVVKDGDTLWAIARKYSISPEDLAEGNMLTLETIIHSGLVLKVPLTDEEENKRETALP